MSDRVARVISTSLRRCPTIYGPYAVVPGIIAGPVIVFVLRFEFVSITAVVAVPVAVSIRNSILITLVVIAAFDW